MPRRRLPGSAAPAAFPHLLVALALPLAFLLLLLLLVAPTPTQAVTPATTSALLVFDPQPGDPCARTPSECGPAGAAIDSCAAALRVDVLSNGTAILTPAGQDYTLLCPTDAKLAFPSSQQAFDPRISPNARVNVKCASMRASGSSDARWPPAAKDKQQQQPALVFSSFETPSHPAQTQDGRPLDGGAGQSLLSGPDHRMTSSALFHPQAFRSALCMPFYCPTPGCLMGKPSALIVLRVAEKGSGRVQVLSGEKTFSCDAWDSADYCARAASGYSYRVVEGSLLGETAPKGAAGGKASLSSPCPLGTGPGKINVPPAPPTAAAAGSIAAGPRDACVASACAGGGSGSSDKPTATTSAVSYPSVSSSSSSSCRACPAGFSSKGGAACVACAAGGWNAPCCAPGFTTKDCPPCPLDKRLRPAGFARLRLASIVSPRPSVQCLDFFRAAAADLAAAITPSYLDDDAKAKAASRCPPSELRLAVKSDSPTCAVELDDAGSGDCPMLKTVAGPDFWAGAGRIPDGTLGTLPFNLTSAASSSSSQQQQQQRTHVQSSLATRFWTGRYTEQDGNWTVAALDPKGAGGRGLLALRLNPIGCVFRYALVEGSLPGSEGEIVASGGGPLPPLPPAAGWCPGATVKAPQPAKLAGGQEVPVCVPK